MTDKPAAIQATYSDIKHIKTRNVYELIFEIPEEDADAAAEALGMPCSGKAIWCAIARMTLEDAKKAAQRAAKAAEDAAPEEKPKQHYRDMKPSQRAGLMCQDAKFWEWSRIGDTDFPICDNENEAASAMRCYLNISSRAELDSVHLGQQNRPLFTFAAMETEFRQWAGYEPSPEPQPKQGRGMLVIDPFGEKGSHYVGGPNDGKQISNEEAISKLQAAVDPQARAGAPSPDVAKPPVKPESEGADSSPSKGIFDTLKLAADHSRTHAQLDGAWRDNKGPRGKLSAQEHEKLLLHYSQRRQEIEREQG